MRPGVDNGPGAGAAGPGQIRMYVGPTDTSGMTAATVKALLGAVHAGGVESAGQAYEDAGQLLGQAAGNVAGYAQRLFTGAWRGSAAQQALAQFQQVHHQMVQQANIVQQAGPPLQWLGGKIIRWYQQHLPHESGWQKIEGDLARSSSAGALGAALGVGSGMLAAHQQHELNQAAQQHLARLNDRIIQANERMPESGPVVSAGYWPRQTTTVGPPPPDRTPGGSTVGGGGNAVGGPARGSGLAPGGAAGGGHRISGTGPRSSGQPSATASLAGYVPPSGAGAPSGGVPAGGVPMGGAPADGGLGVPLIPGMPGGAGGAGDAGVPSEGAAAGADSGAAGADGMAGAGAAEGRGMTGMPAMGGAPGQQDSDRQRHAWMAEDEDLWHVRGEHVVPAVIRA